MLETGYGTVVGTIEGIIFADFYYGVFDGCTAKF